VTGDDIMPITVIESFIRGAGDECADVVIETPDVAGVVDGATAKPWEAPGGPTGRKIAIEIADLLRGLSGDVVARDAVARLTRHVAAMLGSASIAPGQGSAAAFAVVHCGARQVWRVGEAGVLVDGQAVPGPPSGEEVVARARALVLHTLLAAGASLDDLRTKDQGREVVYPLLRSLVTVRNRVVSTYANAAIDGRPVPDGFVEVFDLPHTACEVVVTSDGYPEPAPTLADAEARLRARLERDPLMIQEPPATKGWMLGKESFDDRAYVRLSLPASE
jgi:hypothetical protein